MAASRTSFGMHRLSPVTFFLMLAIHVAMPLGYPKDNGDIYVVNISTFANDKLQRELIHPTSIANTLKEVNYDYGENESNDESTSTAGKDRTVFDTVTSECNSSFSVPMNFVVTFNNTGALPNEVDKTGLCFIRCLFENMGVIKNWMLNREKLQEYVWPATGDSIEYCQRVMKQMLVCAHMPSSNAS